MTCKTLFICMLAASIACNEKDQNRWPVNITPPVPVKSPKTLSIHGDARVDNYYWLNERDNPRTLEYLRAENAYLDTMMQGTKELQEKLFREMKGRIKEKDESVPVFRNGYYYYTRTEEGQEYYKYCRKKQTLDAPEEMLLDVDELSKGHSFFSVADLNVSDDNNLLAFGLDTVGRRQYTIHVKDLQSGKILSDKVYPTDGGSVWANDNKTLFYTVTNPETLLGEKIKKHFLGDQAAADAVVYEEADKSNQISVAKTRSGRYIIIGSRATLSSEQYILSADKPEASLRLFQPRVKNVLYEVDHWGDRFVIVTNWEAQNFRLMETPEQETGREHWKEVIGNRTDVLLQGVEPFKGFLVISERKEGLVQLRIRPRQGEEHYLNFGEPAYAATMGYNPEYQTQQLRFHYTSLTTPSSVYDYNMIDRQKKLLKQQEVLGGYEMSAYTSERVYATARDGVKVPISIVYRKGFARNGESPVLLYGYGSYGYSLDASFNAARISLLDRGFAFAIAHIRGGQEMGRSWYEDGKLMKKKNSFTDFIDCGEFLVKEKYTSPEHLYAMGGSAGGLLMGAVATLRPDLWNGVVAQVPFVDVVTTMLDESIPLTTNEFDEWGNPKNKDAYDYMKSYSPYDNVGSHFPNMLVTTGLHDSQVQYFEPAKWVAKIRELKKDENVILFHTNMTAGHGGASGRFDFLRDVAREYAFLLTLEGIGE